jgi:hypothetical protein
MERLLSFSEEIAEASILPSLAGMARRVNVCQRERSRMSTHGMWRLTAKHPNQRCSAWTAADGCKPLTCCYAQRWTGLDRREEL